MGSHAGTKICYNLASQNDLAFYLRITEIQITIFQSDIFVSFFGMVDLEGQFVVLAFAQHFNGFGNYFNIPGCQLCIFSSFSHARFTIYLNGRLCIDCRKLLHQIFCFNDDLCRSIKSLRITNPRFLLTLRMFSNHPTRVTSCPAFSSLSSPQLCVLPCMFLPLSSSLQLICRKTHKIRVAFFGKLFLLEFFILIHQSYKYLSTCFTLCLSSSPHRVSPQASVRMLSFRIVLKFCQKSCVFSQNQWKNRRPEYPFRTISDRSCP